MYSSRVFSNKEIEKLRKTFWEHHLTFYKEFIEYLDLYPELRDFYKSLSSRGFSKEYYQSLFFALLLTGDSTSGLRLVDFQKVFNPPDNVSSIPDRLKFVPRSESILKKISSEIGKVDNSEKEHKCLLFSERNTDRNREKIYYLSPKLWDILNEIIENIHILPVTNSHLIGLYTFRSPTELESRSKDKIFDFSGYFSPFPSKEGWKEMLSTLKKYAKGLKASYQGNEDNIIRFRCNAHQTLGLMIGYVFSKYKLGIYQSNKLWTFEEHKLDDCMIDHWEINQSDPNQKELSINNLILVLNVTRTLNSFVKQYLMENPIKNSFLCVCTVKESPSKSSIKNQKDAYIKILHLANFMNQLWENYPINKVHLFIRAPFAFLVMMGAYFANLVPIQIYEQSRETLNFQSTILLPLRGSNPGLL